MKHYASFSEAIREGAKLLPQSMSSVGYPHETCAIEAGVHAIYGTVDSEDIYRQSMELYPYLETRVECSCHVGGQSHKVDLQTAIYHLNDIEHWTREMIADWLEEQEEALGFVTVAEAAPEAEADVQAAVALAR
jgi:hypothetical protein